MRVVDVMWIEHNAQIRQEVDTEAPYRFSGAYPQSVGIFEAASLHCVESQSTAGSRRINASMSVPRVSS